MKMKENTNKNNFKNIFHVFLSNAFLILHFLQRIHHIVYKTIKNLNNAKDKQI